MCEDFLYCTGAGQTRLGSLRLESTYAKDGFIPLGEVGLQLTTNKYQSLASWKVAGATVPPLDPDTRATIEIPTFKCPCSCCPDN